MDKTTHQQQDEKPPRYSFETERRHLLSDETCSITPSSSASMIYNNDDGEATPRARSPVRAQQDRPYRGFPSETAYLAALQQFIDSRKYVEYDTMLIGFYGHKTMNDIASQPAPDLKLGLRKKWKGMKARRAEERERRRGSEVVGHGDGDAAESREGVVAQERRNTIA